MQTATARLTIASPAPRTALVAPARAAAFRALLGAAATDLDTAFPGSFRADVSGLALAAMARTLDYDEDAIAVLDHAQFEHLAVTVRRRRDGFATLACAGPVVDDLLPARRPPAR